MPEQQRGDIDCENRDPNDLNAHVQCKFEDILGEPEGAHSLEVCWKCAYSCYNCAFKCCYILLTLCAPIYGLCYGWHYAQLAFCHIWECTPHIRACEINCHMLRKIYSICLSCFLTPLCESCAHCFSKIKVAQ